ncbi:MAG: cell surface protein SprA [Ignavibacteria bacterium]|nr:cell surface protein SprA [Ignavibacteria bacterium]
MKTNIIILKSVFVVSLILFGFTYLSKDELNQNSSFRTNLYFSNRFLSNSSSVESNLENLITNSSDLHNNFNNSNQNELHLNFKDFQTVSPSLKDTNDLEEKLKLEQEIKRLEEQDKILSQKNDSLIIADSLLVVDSLAIDSTARLKHFQYKRKDYPYVNLFEKRKNPFFLKVPDALVSRSVALDSTGRFVVIKETIDGKEWKVRVTIPLEQYIQLRLAYINRKNWEELAYKYDVKLGRKELGDIFAQITNIDIPIPSNPVLSIFGPPKINLRINGAVTIDGSWRNERTEGVTASLLGNVRNEPNFKQDVQINISGTIGDKLTIMADWNTQNTFEYENQLKIKYTGYPDEIVQSVEAGNVSLQTSPLVGGGEALFGVKAKLQLGPLWLTAIASQKKGEVKEKVLSGGAEASQFKKRIYEYSTNHYFVDTVYADTSANLNIFNKFYGNPTPIPVEYYHIKDIEVWKTITGLPNPKERRANAFIYLNPRQRNQTYPDSLRRTIDAVPGQVEVGRFIKLDPSEYIVHYQTGYITFKTQINETDAIAVAYRMEGDPGNDNDIFYGDFVADVADTVTLVLKLIKPANLQPQYKTAWKLQLRNIYPLGVRNVKKEGFELDILYEVPGQEPRNDWNGVRFLNAFGLDKFDASDNPTPDTKFDFRPGITINTETGEIIFPVLQPFGRNFPSNLPDTLKYTDVYDTLQSIARLNSARDKFVIVGKSSGTSASTFNLGFNIVEGSVRVRLAGRELVPNVDYIVDYNTGQLIIRNEQALLPNADLRISYEENTLFQLAAKSLFGLRGELDLSQRTKLGFSMLTLNQQTLSDKVRVGEEPILNSIYGIDAQTSVDLPFITNFLNNFISTREMSVLSLRGEAAYINPDPNTKKSTIASDRGQSVAYIDDFEGAKQIMSIGVNYTSWKSASPPKGYPHSDIDTVIMRRKAKTFWFNRLPSDVLVQQIWPKKTVARGNEQVTVLDVIYSPFMRGEYNYYPDLAFPNLNWGGMMKLLSSTASNFLEQNIEFIEFWILPQKLPQNAKLYIDIGKISEDVIPNKKLDTEDKNFNELIDQGEDVGLDGIPDDVERQLYPNLGSDPSGDNFFFNLGTQNYTGINGTEGNASLTEAGRFPDTEDLNRNGVLDIVNSYFQYEIPLDTNTATNPYIVGGGVETRWYQFRIPLNEFKKKIGEPSFTNIDMIRVWFSGFSDSMHIRIAEFNLVGNQWRKAIKDDPRISLSVVNIEDNSPYYYSPPDVGRELDRTQQTTGTEKIYKNEQSLAMGIHNLKYKESVFAVKVLYRPMDVFNYSEMKLYYHGNRELKNGDIVIRFGIDSNNFYEYREPIREGWQNIGIKFSEITAVKQKRDSITQIIKVPVEGGPPGSFYSIRGNPSLTQVGMFLIGVVHERAANPSDTLELLNGELWVNELRLVGADDREGWAYNASFALNFGDFIRINLNYSKTNPFFHRLEERFGSRVLRTSWGFSGSIDFTKLLPSEMKGSALTLNYSRTEQMDKPLYLPNTDIVVDEAVDQSYARLIEKGYDEQSARRISNGLKTASQSYSQSESWSLSSIKLIIPSDFFLVKDIWNNLGFGFNFSRRFARNPQLESQKDWQWNFAAQYSYMFAPNNYIEGREIPLLGDFFELIKDINNWRFYYTPSNIGMNFNVSRNRATSVYRTDPNRPSVQRDFRAQRGFQFGWKLTDGGFLNPAIAYSIDFGSSYAHLETYFDTVKTSSGRDSIFEVQRTEREIFRDIFKSNLFGRDYSFGQRFEIRTQPRFPSLFNLNNYISLQLGYSVDYRWQNNFQQIELGRSASFANNITTGISIRWRQIWSPLFEETSQPTGPRTPQVDPRNRRQIRDIPDEDKQFEYPGMIQNQKTQTSDTVEVKKPSSFLLLFAALKSGVRWLLVDYDNISINFSQRNSSMNNGLAGMNSGITNFWNFFIPNKDENGPSRLYQLGLSTNPGKRARNGNLSDQITQANSIDLRTSRPLWEGARLDLSWKLNWSYNRTTTIQTDSLGNVKVTNIGAAGTIDRSFITLPPFLIFSFFKNDIKKVYELYNPAVPNPKENLADAFVNGFETLPIIGKLPLIKKFGKYIPRPNWSITWDGLEKYSIFNSFASRVSLQHNYQSSFARAWRLNPDGIEETQSQKITYGFQPLIGMNITFKPWAGGSLGGQFKIGSTVSYDMGVQSRNISETFSRDISFSLNYSKSGFDLPFLGISLKNDLNISISYTQMRNSTVVYDMLNFKEGGTPQDGTIRTTLEPRIRYVISSRLTIAIYYRRVKVEPEGASKIPPTTTNEAGLNINLTI